MRGADPKEATIPFGRLGGTPGGRSGRMHPLRNWPRRASETGARPADCKLGTQRLWGARCRRPMWWSRYSGS